MELVCTLTLTHQPIPVVNPPPPFPKTTPATEGILSWRSSISLPQGIRRPESFVSVMISLSKRGHLGYVCFATLRGISTGCRSPLRGIRQLFKNGQKTNARVFAMVKGMGSPGVY